MQDKANTPAEINETQLDDISGGPHFRTWDATTHRTFASASQGTTAQAAGYHKTAETEGGWILMPNRK